VEKFRWLADWLLPPDSWNFCRKTQGAHARNHIHAQQTQILPSHTGLFHIYINIYIYRFGNLGLIPRRRLAASTAQFRNFYGKSSLIKFNELWKRQQIYDNFLGKFVLNPNRASSISSISWLIFLISRRQPGKSSRMRHRFGLAL